VGFGLITMEVSCSKGTYIRTLCSDIGRRLGCGAVMSGLVRTESGSFRIENAMTTEELTCAFSDKNNPPFHLLTDIDVPLLGFPAIVLEGKSVGSFINGVKVSVGEGELPEGLCRVYAKSGSFIKLNIDMSLKPLTGNKDAFLGIGYYKTGVLNARKVLV